MSTVDRFYARLGIGLLVCAFLVPIVISAFSRDIYAVIFFGLALAFATLFAAISWTQRSSRFVVAVISLIGCMVASAIIVLTYAMPWEIRKAEASYQAIALQHEAARQQAIAERKRSNDG